MGLRRRRNIVSRLTVLGLTLVCFASLLPGTSHGTTFVVRPDGTGDFPTIQNAINAAVDGDVIELADGTFLGDGNRDLSYLGKAITVRSQGGATNCIIDPEGAPNLEHNGFRFTSNEGAASVLEGVTITHGNFAGGGLTVLSSPLIRDCVITANGAGGYHFDGFGGGIQVGGGTARFIGCTISSNTALQGGSGHTRGGGVYVYGGSPTFTSCAIEGNGASGAYSRGGGVDIESNASATFIDCVIRSNVAITGCGIYTESASAAFTGCGITDNTGGLYCTGGGAYCAAGTAEFNTCIFVNNQVMNNGGGILCEDGSAVVVSCTFYGNGAEGGGGGIGLLGSGSATIANTIMANNGYGGPVVCYGGGAATLSCCDLFGNSGGDWVGCIEGQLGVSGNISLDPLFCDAASRDFHLDANSPCRPHSPENPDCDLVGALPVNCGSTPVRVTSWGRIRTDFRGGAH